MVAVDPLGRFSLVGSFGPAAYVVPAAAMIGAAAFLKKPCSRIDLSTAWDPAIATVVAGCCCMGPVFVLRSFRWGEWVFLSSDAQAIQLFNRGVAGPVDPQPAAVAAFPERGGGTTNRDHRR
jgi:hypothetical protein